MRISEVASQTAALARVIDADVTTSSAAGPAPTLSKIASPSDTAQAADVWLAPGEARSVTMAEVPLSNKGGLITLLDAEGIKVDGVSYTKDQARQEGELVIFR